MVSDGVSHTPLKIALGLNFVGISGLLRQCQTGSESDAFFAEVHSVTRLDATRSRSARSGIVHRVPLAHTVTPSMATLKSAAPASSAK